MPVGATIGAAALTSAAVVGSAKMQSSSQGKAADAQSRATADAMAFERDKEARRRSEYDAAMQEYRQRYAQWEQQRNGLLARYGVHPQARPSLASFGQRPAQSPSFGPQGMGGPSTGPTQSLLGGAPRRLSLADFSGQRPETI